MKRFLLSLLVVMSAAMTFAATPYIVEASSLNVRKSPSTDASVIGKLSQGQEVMVQSISNGWATINHKGGTGYVSAKYLRKKSGSTSSASSSRSTTSSSKSTARSNSKYGVRNSFPYHDGQGARYAGWTETGLDFSQGLVGGSLDLVNGCYIRDYIFVGAGVGLRAEFAPSAGLGVFALPIYAQARGVLRVNEYVAPFLDLGIGGFVGWPVYLGGGGFGDGAGGGFYMRVAPGVRIGKHFHLSLGYERLGGFNMGALNVGVDW